MCAGHCLHEVVQCILCSSRYRCRTVLGDSYDISVILCIFALYEAHNVPYKSTT